MLVYVAWNDESPMGVGHVIGGAATFIFASVEDAKAAVDAYVEEWGPAYVKDRGWRADDPWYRAAKGRDVPSRGRFWIETVSVE